MPNLLSASLRASGDTLSEDWRPTAQILGDYRRELIAQGIEHDLVAEIVEAAAHRLLNDGPLVLAGPEGGEQA